MGRDEQRNEQGCGVKKPQKAQKAKDLCKMKAAKDAGDETRFSTLGRALKDPIVALDKALKYVEILYQRSRPECFVEGAFSNGCCWLPPTLVGKADLGRRLALLGSDGQCVFTHSIHGMECAKESTGRMASSFFLIQKEPAIVPDSETFSPFINSDIRTVFSPLMFSRSVRSSPCT